MKRKTIAELEAEIASVRGMKDDYCERWRADQKRAQAAEESLKESRSHFADLKEQLHNAETETSRLNGYLARVHEDDIVRDGLVEIEDGDGKRSVPRRPPPLQAAETRVTSHFDAMRPYGGEKKRTHWTSY